MYLHALLGVLHTSLVFGMGADGLLPIAAVAMPKYVGGAGFCLWVTVKRP
jgi:nitrate reductase NapE component